MSNYVVHPIYGPGHISGPSSVSGFVKVKLDRPAEFCGRVHKHLYFSLRVLRRAY